MNARKLIGAGIQLRTSPKPFLLERLAKHDKSKGFSFDFQDPRYSIEEVLSATDTDFTVVKKAIQLKDSRTLITTRSILGIEGDDQHYFDTIVSGRYHPVSNKVMLENAMGIIGDGGGTFDYCCSGTSDDRSIAYYAFKEDNINLPNVGLIDLYIVVLVNHNKSSCKIKLTPVKVDSQSRITLGKKDTLTFAVRHNLQGSISLKDKFKTFIDTGKQKIDDTWGAYKSAPFSFQDDFRATIRTMLGLDAGVHSNEITLTTAHKGLLTSLELLYHEGLGQSSLPDDSYAKALGAISCYENNYYKRKPNLNQFINPALTDKFVTQTSNFKF